MGQMSQNFPGRKNVTSKQTFPGQRTTAPATSVGVGSILLYIIAWGHTWYLMAARHKTAL